MPAYAVVGFAALTLVVVDSFVAGTRGSQRQTHQTAIAAHQQVVAIGHGARADAVASGGGSIWTLVHAGDRRYRRYAINRVNPQLDKIAMTYQVPGPASYLFYGAGRVWVSGGSRLSALDPHNGHVATLRVRGGVVRSMAFERSTAFAAVVGRDEILAIRPGRSLQVKAIEERGGPLAVIALRRAIEVTNNSRNLVPIIDHGANTSFLAALELGLPVIGVAGPDQAWVSRGRSLILESLGAGSSLTRRYVRLPGRPIEVVTAPDGGCYVSLVVPRHGRSRTALAYLSGRALRVRHPRLTARHRGPQVAHLALDPVGGVVFTDVTGHLRRWIPPMS